MINGCIPFEGVRYRDEIVRSYGRKFRETDLQIFGSWMITFVLTKYALYIKKSLPSHYSLSS